MVKMVEALTAVSLLEFLVVEFRVFQGQVAVEYLITHANLTVQPIDWSRIALVKRMCL